MKFSEKVMLGRTGLQAGRLGMSSSFGAPAKAFEEAFEKGCNYFSWGTFVKGRSSEMAAAIKEIIKKGQRENLILSMLTYAHNAAMTEYYFKKGLKAIGSDHADILLLGYYSKRPPQRVIDGALRMKEQGLVRFIGLTSHKRPLFPKLSQEGIFDLFHVRYNAVNRGAETEVFPLLNGDNLPGIVTFTATKWGRLLSARKVPPDFLPPSAADCYRFVLSNPSVDVCMMGPRSIGQMRENLTVLELEPMSAEELARMRLIGDAFYRKRIFSFGKKL